MVPKTAFLSSLPKLRARSTVRQQVIEMSALSPMEVAGECGQESLLVVLLS